MIWVRADVGVALQHLKLPTRTPLFPGPMAAEASRLGPIAFEPRCASRALAGGGTPGRPADENAVNMKQNGKKSNPAPRVTVS